MSIHPFILASLCRCPYVPQVKLPELYQPNTTMNLPLSPSTSTASSGKFICDSRSVSFALHVFFQLAKAPVHYSEEHLGNHNSHGPAQKLMETRLRFFRGRFQKEPLPQEGSGGFVVFIPEMKGWIGQKIRQMNGWVEGWTDALRVWGQAGLSKGKKKSDRRRDTQNRGEWRRWTSARMERFSSECGWKLAGPDLERAAGRRDMSRGLRSKERGGWETDDGPSPPLHPRVSIYTDEFEKPSARFWPSAQQINTHTHINMLMQIHSHTPDGISILTNVYMCMCVYTHSH